MSGIYGPLATQIASYVSSIILANYCAVATATVVLYDHICTTPQEVQLIWGSKLTSTMVLFYANRWLILTYAILSIMLELFHSGTNFSCAMLTHIFCVVDLCLCALWAAFSGIRVYALSGGSRLLSLAVTLLGFVPMGTTAYYNFYGNNWQLVTFPVLGLQCLDSRDVSKIGTTRFASTLLLDNLLPMPIVSVDIGLRLPVIIADIVVLVLTWWKTWATVRMARELDVKTPLMTLLLRDGTLYFVALLSLNALNIAGFATNVFTFASTFSIPLSSIIITHFLLNLRQLAHASDDDNSRPSFVRDRDPDQVHSRTSSLRYSSFVGNMCESLDHGSENNDEDLSWDGDDGQDDTEYLRSSADLSSLGSA